MVKGGEHMEPALVAMILGNIGPMEWIIIIGLALLIFGGRRLGEIGKGMGEGIKNFRSAVKEEKAPEPEKGSKPSA
jgi:sec-independent protein translocase protein TatA